MLCLFALLTAATPARASSISVFGNIITAADGASGANPSLTAIGFATDSVTGPGGSSAAADAIVGAAPGALHSRSSASHGLDGTTKYAEAIANVSETDFMPAGAGLSGLANGTPIQVIATIGLTGFSTPILNATGGAYEMDAIVAAHLIDLTTGQEKDVRFDLSQNSGGFTATLNAFVGDQLQLSQFLDTFAYVNGDSPLGTSTADFSNTAHFYLDSNVPGITFIGTTGHDYATPQDVNPGPVPVPEPATLLLVGAGLVAARRTRRSH